MGYQTIITTLLFLSAILIHFAHLTAAQPSTGQMDIFLNSTCRNLNLTFTDNSVYQTNLESALSLITSNVNNTIYGFNSTSVGQNPETAYALALCRGDVDPITCGQCVYNSTFTARAVCPNQREAIVWFEFCMLSYSSVASILTNMDAFSVSRYVQDPNNVTDVAQFNEDLRTLFNDLRRRSADGGPQRKFATGNVSGTNSMDIYGLMQCTPNLPRGECDRCLNEAALYVPTCCNNRRGARVLMPSCNIRFEVYPFFQRTIGDAAPMPAGENDNRMRTVVIIVVAIVVSVFLVVASIWTFIRKRKQRKPNVPLLESIDADDISMAESLQYDLETIRTASDNFSESNKLGQGGFGTVYKGRLLNGIEIAVKRLAENSGQGELEFKNEVVILAKLQHRNLVRLIGFCLQGIERLLIYEFVCNASLDQFIFDPVNKAVLNWDKRYKIIEGIARGLLYLHEESRHRIIHRDLKASNILLDANMDPKIADFGLAKLFERDETQGNTRRIAGTYGYMAPEYAMRGQFSVKSDVFSFGVLVLEMISGQRNNGFRNGEIAENLLSYASNLWRRQNYSEFIDPILSSSPIHDMKRCMHIGLLCVQENMASRPTMGSIVLMLSSFSITLPIPSEPAFFINDGASEPENSHFGESSSVASGSTERNNVTAEVSIDDASITKIYPRQSLGSEPESVPEMMRCIQIGLLRTQDKIERPTIDLAYKMLTCSYFTVPVLLKPPFHLDCTTLVSKLSDLQNNSIPQRTNLASQNT